MPQTVVWSQNLPALQYGSPIELIGTSSSGLPVQFRVTIGEATYENGFITPIGVGQLTIEAYQSGDEIFSASNVVTKTFTVSKAPLIVRAGDADRKVFLPNPEFQLYYDSFRLGDTVEDLDKVPEAYTTANEGAPVGQYVIQILPGESSKYELELRRRRFHCLLWRPSGNHVQSEVRLSKCGRHSEFFRQVILETRG